MNTNGWDTISVLNIAQVNTQLAARLNELTMTFDTTWVDGFSGKYAATGSFGPWSIVGGSGTDIYINLPIKSGTVTPDAGGAATDISGMAVEVVVNLEWVPSTVTPQGQDLKFQLTAVTAKGATRQPGEIFVKSVSDPNNTGIGTEVGDGIAHVLLDNKDKITFIFAQTGIVDTATSTWLTPKQSKYSFHTPVGGGNSFLAIFSLTTSTTDISTLVPNLDAGIASSQYPLSFVISGNLFLENAILPALPATLPNSTAGNFSYANGQINLVSPFDMPAIKVGAIYYTPTVSAMTLSVNGNALASSASGSSDLHLPNADLTFWAKSNNVLTYDVATATFAFTKDPNPQHGSDSHIPWYDYLFGGAIGAAITAAVLAAVESCLGDALGGSNLAGSLASAPSTTVQWAGLNQISIKSGSLNDCMLLLADVS